MIFFWNDLLPLHACRPVGARGAGDAIAPPDFGRSGNPISTGGGGTDYAHHITTAPRSGFLDPPTALCLSPHA